MWEWFTTNGVWILVAVVAGLILFFLLRRWALRAMGKVVPAQWHEQIKGTQRIEIPWPHVKLYLGENQVSGDIACGACSHINLPGGKFCSNCGAKLSP